MFEAIFELFAEAVLQVILEILAELGLHSVAEPFRRQPDPWMAALGYTLLGALFGGISLLVFPNNLVPGAWRVVNLIATPIVAGAVMAGMGAWRARRGQPVLRIDRFAYGFLFALAIALIRFCWAA